MIIVDDNSSDNSFEIVDRYKKKDRRIKLYKNPGNGIIEALRFAFKKSNGEYVTRMDSDDIMLSDKLEILINNLKSNGKKYVAIGLVQYFRSDGISEGYDKYEKWLNGLTKQGNNFSEIYKECVIPSPCWMMHRDDLERCKQFIKQV